MKSFHKKILCECIDNVRTEWFTAIQVYELQKKLSRAQVSQLLLRYNTELNLITRKTDRTQGYRIEYKKRKNLGSFCVSR